MNKRFKLAALMVSLALSCGAHAQIRATPVPGQGTWETTLQGRDLDGDITNGYEAFYDTKLNVTWLNPSPWSSSSNLRDAYQYSGNWVDVNNFAKQLDVFGVTGWRLPSVNRDLGTVGLRYWQGDSFRNDDVAFSSELDYLYYVTLGNYGVKNSIYGFGGDYRSGVRAGWVNSGSLGLYNSWDKTTTLDLPSILWLDAPRGTNGEILSVDVFETYSGGGNSVFPSQTPGALFVRSGDVGLAANVPEPQTYALVLAGLMVTASAARRRKT